MNVRQLSEHHFAPEIETGLTALEEGQQPTNLVLQ